MSVYEQAMKVVNPCDRDGLPLMPTEDQRCVIESDASSILVVAGAGSGKTRTMANRIAYWVAAGKVRPSEILGLTFTRKAAGELDSRVAQSLAALRRAELLDADLEAGSVEAGRAELEQPTISTYNSFGSAIAQSYGLLIAHDPSARLITEAERNQLMGEVVDSLPDELASRFTSKPVTVAENALALAASLVDNGVEVEEARAFYASQLEILEEIIAMAPSRMSWMSLYDDPVAREAAKASWGALKNVPATLAEGQALCEVAALYLEEKQRRNLVEFSDQIAVAVKALQGIPSLSSEISSRYRLVLLDEYQDTSVSQAKMLSLALGEATGQWRSVAAVGDPNQAIYGWRGASANAFADFAKDFVHLGVPEAHTLATTFRNDVAILEAANIVASSITNAEVKVGQLEPRPKAGPGRVVEIRPLRRLDSFRAMALRMSDVMEEVRATEGRPAEMAVLCRKRSYIDFAAHALAEAGVPYEIVGGISILERPEVATVRCALQAAASTERSDALARLCGYLNIGVADLRALRNGALSATKAELARLPGGEHLDARGELSLVAALDVVAARRPDGMSAEAHERLSWLANALSKVRSRLHMPLGELVHSACRELGLYLAAISRAEGARRVTTSLDSFAAMASQYSYDHPEASLADFLAWLDAVESHEHGGEGESGLEEKVSGFEAEVNPGVVQIMTVHAAKGLEWRDLVAIPEMVEGQFSNIDSDPTLWPTQKGVFPYPLRADRAHLPSFMLKKPDTHSTELANLEAIEDFAAFRQAELEYESQEARRLAYVAMTRPQAELLLVGYGIADAAKALLSKGQQREEPVIIGRSAFLDGIDATPIGQLALDSWTEEYGESEASRLCYVCPEAMSVDELVTMLDESEIPAAGPEPVPDYSAETYLSFPVDLPRNLTPAPLLLDTEMAEHALDLLEAEEGLLVAEMVQSEREEAPRLTRPYLTATDVVSLASAPQEFMADQARPVPHEPSLKARVGTEVHQRISESYLLAPTLDIDGTSGSVVAGPDEQIERLFAAYASSRWAQYRPILVEESLSVVVGGRVVRCTVDAVLSTEHVPDLKKYTIVDWKTGSVPRAQQLASREIQLALYRLAYSVTSGVPLEDIGACFVHLNDTGQIVEVFAGEGSKEDIEHMIARGIDALPQVE